MTTITGGPSPPPAPCYTTPWHSTGSRTERSDSTSHVPHRRSSRASPSCPSTDTAESDQGKDAAIDAFGEEVRHNSFQSDTPGVGDR